MTRFSSDQLAKQYLQDFLEPLGTVQRNFEVPGEAKYVDILFLPNPAAIQSHNLGLLGRMVMIPSMLEPFRNPPTREEIESCIHKRGGILEEQRRRAKQENRKLTEEEQPRLWMVEDWPEGVYFLLKPFRTALVAINKLPVVPDTLWLRLLGRGSTQKRAVDELLAMPQDDTRRSQALQLLVSWRITLNPDEPLDGEEQELMATLSQAYLEWEQRTRSEGEQRGREAGRQEEAATLILRQLTHRLGDLPSNLLDRAQALPLAQLENLGEALLDFKTLADLQNWLGQD
jgi:hypothetical protein